MPEQITPNPDEIEIGLAGNPENIQSEMPPAPTLKPNFLSEDDIPVNASETIILDAEKGISIESGVPLFPKSSPEANRTIIDIPDRPHVFLAHRITLVEKEGRKRVLENIPLIIGHAVRVRSGNNGSTWNFVGGQEVTSTVQALDHYCQINQKPRMELVIACSTTIAGESEEIKVKDIRSDRPIIQVVGENIGLNLGANLLFDNGFVEMQVEAEEFWGLDEYIERKEIEEQVKIVE